MSLFKHWRTSFERIEKYLSDTYFSDVNLTSLIITEESELLEIDHLTTSTNPGLSTEDSLDLFDKSALKFESVSTFSDEKWEKVDLEQFTFGLTWSVHWFRVRFRVPSSWLERPDHSIELHWDAGCEALVFNESGRPVLGLNSTHHRVAIDIEQLLDRLDFHSCNGTLFLQVSCSDLFGAGKAGLINAPENNKSFRIALARLRLVNRVAVELARDLRLLMQLAEALKDTDIGHRALFRANDAINALVDVRTERNSPRKLERARELVEQFFSHNNNSDHGDISERTSTEMTLHVMGHCHIDTAWLWRYGETRRKTARSWTSSLRLLERHPQMRFVCSQAQQLDWLREDHPGLFQELRVMATAGRFVPTAASWVEMDVQLPCAESLCRQFLYGQRFSRAQFGTPIAPYCCEFWLPDTFGYSPQLPQIMRLSRVSRFVTQKMSWSLFNQFPHHSFRWVGLDGSDVLAHFPPGDSYSMLTTVSEVLHSVNNFKDKGRSSHAMFLYGHGDGGQGPTQEMLHILGRMARCPGLPRIVHSSPSAFFSRLEQESTDKLSTWHGELFLELHNGTYTTQRQLKLGNAHCEQLLRAVELLVSLVLCDHESHSAMPPDMCEQLERQWKAVLLGQFHDVLPGTSIEQVCEDAWCSHRAVLTWCQDRLCMLSTILGTSRAFLVNPTSWPLLVPVDTRDELSSPSRLCLVDPLSVRSVRFAGLDRPMTDDGDCGPGVTCRLIENELYSLTNRHFEVVVDVHCRIRSLNLLPSSLGNLMQERICSNELMLYDDIPLFWDAWDVMDYHLETESNIQSVASFELVESARLVGESTGQSVTLRAIMKLATTGTLIETSISVHEHLPYISVVTKVLEWRETHRMLKVQIATRANAIDAQYRTQAGYQSRPTHRNTSWDTAKFEVCGHDWVHVGEANWGVAILKDAIFGSSVVGGTISLSLLRSPSFPDPTADKKHLPHVFNYAIYPYQLTGNEPHKFATITRWATQFSWLCAWDASRVYVDISPALPGSDVTDGAQKSFPISLISPAHGEVAIDWIKPSCDYINKFVIRLHEQIGGSFPVKLVSQRVILDAKLVDILEESHLVWNEEPITVGINSIDLFIKPFRIVSLMIEFQ